MAIQDREENLTLSQDHEEMCLKVETSWAPSLKLALTEICNNHCTVTKCNVSESTQCQVKAFLPIPSLSLVRQRSCGHSGFLLECSRLVWREEAGQRTGRLAFFCHAEQCWDSMQMLSCLGSSRICLHFVGKWWWWVGVKVEDMLQSILGVLNDPPLVRISQMLEVWPGTVWT